MAWDKDTLRAKGYVHQRRYIAAHRVERRLASREMVKKRKGELLKMLGGKCVDCGYCEHFAALDFDHVGGSQKSFCIGSKMGTRWDDLVSEAMKCVIRCANCHRIKTAIERLK